MTGGLTHTKFIKDGHLLSDSAQLQLFVPAFRFVSERQVLTCKIKVKLGSEGSACNM